MNTINKEKNEELLNNNVQSPDKMIRQGAG